MTNPTRSAVVRTIASSLAFDADPPILRSLDKARAAAGSIVDALVDAGMIELAGSAPADGVVAEFTNGQARSPQGDVETIAAFE